MWLFYLYRYTFTKRNTADTEINLSALPTSKSNLMSEPIYEGITATSESQYVGVNMNTEPNYESMAANLNMAELDPEYEAVTGNIPQSPIYVNTIVKPPGQLYKK